MLCGPCILAGYHQKRQDWPMPGGWWQNALNALRGGPSGRPGGEKKFVPQGGDFGLWCSVGVSSLVWFELGVWCRR